MECNRFVAYWQTKRNFDIHQQKLKSIKSVIKYTVCNSNRKGRTKSRNQGYSYRQHQIQLQNRALLSKITKKEHHVTNLREAKCQFSSKGSKKNKYFQKYQIQIENKDLLKKLKTIKSDYKSNGFLNDYKESQKYKNMICKFPIKGLKPTKTFFNIQSRLNKSRTSRVIQGEDQLEDLQINKLRKPLQPISNMKTQLRFTNHQQFTQSYSRGQYNKQRIKKLFPIQQIRIDNQKFIIKGIQYESYIQLQIMMDCDQSFPKTIQLKTHIFHSQYNSSFKALCHSISYNHQYDQFYIR